MKISLTYSDYAVMVIYILALVAIGVLCSGRKKNSQDYLLGGKKMPFFALGISCLMAALSAFSLVMVPGEIFNNGLSFWILSLIAPLFMLVTCRVFMRFYFKLGSFTPFEYLEHRYNPSIRLLIAGLTMYLKIIYLGMVLFSTSKIFEGAAGWPPWITILIIGIISVVFTAAGGLKAIVWTDVMQFIVLVGGLVLILGFLFAKIDGGLIGGLIYAFQNGRGLENFSQPDFYLLNPYVRLSFWLLLMSQFLAPIAMMSSDQITVQRLLASGSYKNALKTQTVNTFLTIPTMIILWIIGLSVFSFYHQHPELKVQSGDTALFSFISTQLPPPVPGLIIAGMMAAVISTLNATFNGMAVVYLKEFHQRYFNPEISELTQVKISRIATLAIGLVSIVFGMIITFSAEMLRQSVVEASTIFSAFDMIIIPAFVFAVISKRASSLLVWITAGLTWGLKLGLLTWYMLSTNVVKDFIPGNDPGFGGRLSMQPAILMLTSGIIIFIIWFMVLRRKKWTNMITLVISMMTFGYGLGLLLWSILSKNIPPNTVQALSFQWVSLPPVILYILIGILWLSVGTVQKKEKYQGLTLFD